jgi:iron complex outermembrane receptor protein
LIIIARPGLRGRFSYADAKLTSDFSLPANNGHGVIVDGLISGKSGQQLPGSPKTSATANLTYDRTLLHGYDMTLALNGSYHSRVKLNLANSLGTTTVQESSSYAIMNLSATVSHLGWHLTGYVTNNLSSNANTDTAIYDVLGRVYSVRLSYSFR